MLIVPDVKSGLPHFTKFLFAYLISCGFQDLFSFPMVGSKIQLPEIVFLLGLLLFIFKSNSIGHLFKINANYNIWYFAGFLWLAAHLISFVLNPGMDGLLEIIGCLYLIILAHICLSQFENLTTTDLRHIIVHCLFYLGWIMSISAMIGYLLSVFVHPNFTAQIFYDYPYFGSVFRLQGFTSTPAMYVSIITLCIGFCLYQFYFSGKQTVYLLSAITFSLIALLSFSKSVLFIALLWFCITGYARSVSRKYLISGFLFIVFVHFFLSHFLIVDQQKLSEQNFINSPYTSNEIVFSLDRWAVVGSGYYSFKKAAIHLFYENPLFGVGPGNYNRQIALLKTTGIYPEHLPNYDPHSMITGTLAGLGIFGFVALILIWTCLFKVYVGRNKIKEPFDFCLLLFLSLMFAEGLSMDIMNFRHYWVFFALCTSRRLAPTDWGHKSETCATLLY